MGILRHNYIITFTRLYFVFGEIKNTDGKEAVFVYLRKSTLPLILHVFSSKYNYLALLMLALLMLPIERS